MRVEVDNAIACPQKPGRPRIDRTPTPSSYDFDAVARRIVCIPKGRDRAIAKQDAIRAVRCDRRIAGVALGTFVELIDRLFWKDGSAEISAAAVARSLDVQARCAERAIHDLVACGHIIRRAVRISHKQHSVAETTFPGLVETPFRTDKQNGKGTDKQNGWVPTNKTVNTSIVSKKTFETASRSNKIRGKGTCVTAVTLNSTSAHAEQAAGSARLSDLPAPAHQLTLQPTARAVRLVKESAVAKGHDPDVAIQSTWNLYNIGKIGRDKDADARFAACWHVQIDGVARRHASIGFKSIGLASLQLTQKLNGA